MRLWSSLTNTLDLANEQASTYVLRLVAFVREKQEKIHFNE